MVKKIITAGEGWEYPEAGDEVTGKYQLTVCSTACNCRGMTPQQQQLGPTLAPRTAVIPRNLAIAPTVGVAILHSPYDRLRSHTSFEEK